MRHKQIIILIIPILFLFAYTSCIKDNFDLDKLDKEISYDGSFAFPAVWGDIGLLDALERFDKDGIIGINEDGYLSLFYFANLRSEEIQDIIFLPEQHVEGIITAPDFDFSGFNSPGDSVHASSQFIVPFDVFNEDAELERILLKSGDLDISSLSSFEHSAKLYLTFPSITKNGQAFSKTFTFAHSGDAVSASIDFSGYNIDLTQTPQGFNEIPVIFAVSLFHSGSSNNSGTLEFSAKLKNLKYDIIKGFFGINSLIFEGDQIDITIFKTDQFTIEAYRFEDPKFKVRYRNSFGLPCAFYFSLLTINSALDEEDYEMIHYEQGIPMDSSNPYMISYPTNVGTTAKDSLIVDRHNSNIADILEKRPQWLQFMAHANTNPKGATRNNFITSESVLELEVLVELPLWGYIYNFYRHDTIKFDMSDIYDEWNPIYRALARIDIQNGLPIEAFGQVYFADADYKILDSVFYTYEERLLAPANVDANGKVLNFERKVTKIELDHKRLEKIKPTKYLIIGGQANTTNAVNQEPVRIYDDYRIIFDLGFEVDFEFDVDLDTIN